MRRSWLISQFVKLCIIRGLKYGALCGMLFVASLVLPFVLFSLMTSGAYIYERIFQIAVMSLIGGFIGGIIGFGAYLLMALLISIITISAFSPLHNPTRYLKTVQYCCTSLFGLALSLCCLFLAAASGLLANTLIGLLISCFTPITLVIAALWRSSYEVAHWYVHTAEAHATLEQNIAKQFSNSPHNEVANEPRMAAKANVP